MSYLSPWRNDKIINTAICPKCKRRTCEEIIKTFQNIQHNKCSVCGMIFWTEIPKKTNFQIQGKGCRKDKVGYQEAKVVKKAGKEGKGKKR